MMQPSNLKLVERLPKAGRFLMYSLFAILMLFSCRQAKTSQKVDQNTYFTCSMHPQIRVEKPGDCPICGMKLIKVTKATTSHTLLDTGALSLTDQQIALAGIKTEEVKTEPGQGAAMLTGTVRTNETQAQVMSAKVSGRIEHLYIRTIGEKIALGTPLYTLYSEDLRLAESEYLLASQQAPAIVTASIDYDALIYAARNKLFLWGLTENQLKALIKAGKIPPNTTILSSVQGTVSEISVHEGDYIVEGTEILKSQVLNSLWVEAQVYSGETGFKPGTKVRVLIPELQGIEEQGVISFIQPELSESSKIMLVRVPIKNTEGRIRPGMQAAVSVPSGGGQKIAITQSALLSDEKGSYVWLEKSAGKFIKRKIKTGSGDVKSISVVSGLMPGDRVVTQGVYLLNSEAMLKNVADPIAMDPNMKM